MTNTPAETLPRRKTAAELEAEYQQIRKQAEKDLRDLNSGRKTELGFFRFLFGRKRT